MKTVSNEVFDELKREALKIWKTYDDTHGYATEKINLVNSIINHRDSYGTIIGMFDVQNQRILYNAVSQEAQKAIDDWVGGSLEENEKMARMMGLA